ncbi:MAG: DUF3575 domain-containing protein [Parabacteroides sp.]|nr:DUF3575 domain-containing protein [Parabacteroides sp.]
MKKVIVVILVLCSYVVSVQTPYQYAEDRLYSPKFAIKTNALYWATTTPNLGIEFVLGEKWTMDISANYNFWNFSNNKKIKHWLIQPEARYWFCDRFNGHFIGIHGHYGEYNFACIRCLGLKGKRYEGNLYGGGLSYGYNWLIGKRWNLEAVIGLGFTHLDYSKYPCDKCGEKIKDGVRNFFGPTKVGLNLVYIIK